MEVVDSYSGAWSALFIGISECLGVCWLYGFNNYSKDLSLMMPWIPLRNIRILSVAFWGFITPSILIFIVIFTALNYQAPESTAELITGWTVCALIVIWLPLGAVWAVKKQRTSGLMAKLSAAFKPARKWGPYLESHRSEADHLSELTQMAPEPKNKNRRTSVPACPTQTAPVFSLVVTDDES